MEVRRLEDRIRELCTKAVSLPAALDAEFNQVMQELREALHQHAERIRQVAATRGTTPERRKR